jgi:hypothetical protein
VIQSDTKLLDSPALAQKVLASNKRSSLFCHNGTSTKKSFTTSASEVILLPKDKKRKKNSFWSRSNRFQSFGIGRSVF